MPMHGSNNRVNINHVELAMTERRKILARKTPSRPKEVMHLHEPQPRVGRGLAIRHAFRGKRAWISDNKVR